MFKPLYIKLSLPTTNLERYPVFMDPRDPDCVEKWRKILKAKFTNLLRVLLKMQSWSQNPETAKTYLRQFLKQRKNPNLEPDQRELIQ